MLYPMKIQCMIIPQNISFYLNQNRKLSNAGISRNTYKHSDLVPKHADVLSAENGHLKFGE